MGRDSRHATAVDTSNTFGCSTFTALSAKNMVVAATVVMISLSPMFFLRSKLLSPLMVIIIPSQNSIVKYANVYGKDSKYTNAIDIRITGGGVGSAVGRGDGSVGGAVSRAGGAIGRGGGGVGGAGSLIASTSATFSCII